MDVHGVNHLCITVIDKTVIKQLVIAKLAVILDPAILDSQWDFIRAARKIERGLIGITDEIKTHQPSPWLHNVHLHSSISSSQTIAVN